MNFSPKFAVPFVAVTALVIVGGIYLAGAPDADVKAVPEPPSAPAPAASAAPVQADFASPTFSPAAAAPAPGSSGPLLQDKEQILEAIQEVTVTYDPQELPKLQPYLLHADPEIRQAARQGMVDMGDAAAGPLLRAASRLALTPQEAVELSEAADYVELPPASVIGIKTRRPALLKKSIPK